MKRNDLLILIATISYSYLFYDQNAGLNFFVFNVILLILVLVRDKSLLKRVSWMAVAIGALISSFFIFWWSTWLPILANICSLLMLAGLSFNPKNSIAVAAVNSMFSVPAAVPLSIARLFSQKRSEHDNSLIRKLPLVVIPVFITLIFLLLYRAGNPVFEKFTNHINLNFISGDWVLFTIIGFVLMFGFFYHQFIHSLTKVDTESGDNLSRISLEEHMQRLPFFSVSNELQTGIILFILLNCLLLSVNALDVYFMWIVQELPSGISIAQYLHDGANTLILSIVLAISVILYFFRGYLNFHEHNKWLKLLSYGWIAQNMLLVITTAHRNWWIIESTGLTRKRIGVYVYLSLCLIGLITTLIKVLSQKSNWFLIRKNSWAFYAVFVMSCAINWDNIIVSYNCKNYKMVEIKHIDRGYQSELSHTSLYTLFYYYILEKKEENPDKVIFTENLVADMYSQYKKLENEVESSSWKSCSISKKRNLDMIKSLIKSGEVEAMPR